MTVRNRVIAAFVRLLTASGRGKCASVRATKEICGKGRPAGLALGLWVLCGAAFGATVCFEAEHANEVSHPFEIAEVKDASGGLALAIPEGAGSGHAFAEEAGLAGYRTVLEEGGTYSVWLLVWWNGHCSNSVFVEVDEARRFKTESKTLRRWHWVRAGAWKLEKGKVELLLRHREDGVRIDQILLSTEETNPPAGAVKGSVIPGYPVGERPEPRLYLGSSGENAGLPPTDFRLSHRGIKILTQDPFRTVVLGSGGASPLALWFRNNRLKESAGSVEVVTDAPVDILPGAVQPFRIKDGVPLGKVEFSLKLRKDTPRRDWKMLVRVRHEDGKVEVRRLSVMRPFQWLVTNALACPEASGIETVSVVEGNTGRGFPGSAGTVAWREAPPEAVTPFGLVDMRRAVADKTYVMAYAYTAVRCEAEGEYVLDLRHDDMIRIWLNGIDVFTGARTAPSDSTRKLVKVKLREGENHVLVKLCQLKNYWEFGLRFRTTGKKYAAVTGLEVKGLPAGERGGR